MDSLFRGGEDSARPGHQKFSAACDRLPFFGSCYADSGDRVQSIPAQNGRKGSNKVPLFVSKAVFAEAGQELSNTLSAPAVFYNTGANWHSYTRIEISAKKLLGPGTNKIWKGRQTKHARPTSIISRHFRHIPMLPPTCQTLQNDLTIGGRETGVASQMKRDVSIRTNRATQDREKSGLFERKPPIAVISDHVHRSI